MILLLTGAGISGVVAGCGSARTTDARVAGVVEVCGAPFPRATPAQAHHCTPQAGSVSVFDETHRVVRRKVRSRRCAARVSHATLQCGRSHNRG
jgi:hypothetical protein